MNLNMQSYVQKAIEVDCFQIESEEILHSNIVKWAKTETRRPQIGDWVVFARGDSWVISEETFDELFRPKTETLTPTQDKGFKIRGNVKYDGILYNDNGENVEFEFDENGNLIGAEIL